MTRPTLSTRLCQLQRCRSGPTLFLKNDTYIGRSMRTYGEYAQLELDFLEALIEPGQWVVDGGANIGCHSRMMARKVGPNGGVLAFEPQRFVFQVLCANLALADLQQVQAFPVALGDRDGQSFVQLPDYEREDNFGGIPLGPGQPVEMRRLDSMQLPHCHLIKLDLEGSEYRALQGAQQTLQRHRPLLYVENDRPEQSTALLDWLYRQGYRCFWHRTPLFNPENFAGRAENVLGQVHSHNVLGWPEERPYRLALDEVDSRERTLATTPSASPRCS